MSGEPGNTASRGHVLDTSFLSTYCTYVGKYCVHLDSRFLDLRSFTISQAGAQRHHYFREHAPVNAVACTSLLSHRTYHDPLLSKTATCFVIWQYGVEETKQDLSNPGGCRQGALRSNCSHCVSLGARALEHVKIRLKLFSDTISKVYWVSSEQRKQNDHRSYFSSSPGPSRIAMDSWSKPLPSEPDSLQFRLRYTWTMRRTRP